MSKMTIMWSPVWFVEVPAPVLYPEEIVCHICLYEVTVRRDRVYAWQNLSSCVR